MPDANELEELTDDFLAEMAGTRGVDYHGRKAEQTEVLGSMGERCWTDCVFGEDFCKR